MSLMLLLGGTMLFSARLLLHLRLGFSESVWTGLYNGVIIGSGVFCLLFGRRGERVPWLLLGGALLLYGAGLVYADVVLAHMAAPPYPSIADALWLSCSVPTYLGLFLLLRARGYGFRASLFLDGMIGALAVAAVGTAIVLGSVIGVTSGARAAVITSLAYPILNITLSALIAVGFALTGWRPDRSWALLGLGGVVFALTNSIFSYQLARGTYAVGGALDLGWIFAPVIIAVACAVPVHRRKLVQPGLSLLGLPVLFVLVALGLLVWNRFEQLLWVSVLLAGLCVLLAIVRMALTFGENVSLLSERTDEAETDPLTGLGNRRRLMVDLDRAVHDQHGSTMLALFDLNGFKHYNDTFGHPAGDELLRRLGGSLATAAAEMSGRGYRMGGDEFCLLTEIGGRPCESLVDNAVGALSEEGALFTVSAAHGFVELPADATDASAAMRLADQRMYANKESARMSAGEQSTSALLAALLKHDPGLDEHVKAVVSLTSELGDAFQLDPEAIIDLRIAATLHDVGKVAIPRTILDKPSSLDETELAFVRTHTLVGETIMQAAPALAAAARFVRSSHERYDGAGYPDGLSGEQIPLESRILFACDAFDAMTSERSYAPALSTAEALDELRRNAGGQFDPGVTSALIDLITNTPATRNADGVPTPAPRVPTPIAA